MDGAANNTITERLIALDIEDAATRLYEELLDEKLRGDRCDWGYGPTLDRAWDRYVERGAFNYPWWDGEGAFNADGWTAFNRFADGWDRAALG